MALEPGRRGRPGRALPGQQDLEGALAKTQRRGVTGVARGLIQDTIDAIDAPIEFLLPGDHQTTQPLRLASGGIQFRAAGQALAEEGGGQPSGPLLSKSIQPAC